MYIFEDLQKAFDTVGHNISLAKLEHYGIRGVANDWLISYLFDRRKIVSINGFNSNHAIPKYGVIQGSVREPMFILIFINDLSHTVKYCKMHPFAGDTKLLHFSRSIIKLNRLVILDTKHESVWVNANKSGQFGCPFSELCMFHLSCSNHVDQSQVFLGLLLTRSSKLMLGS